MLTNDQTLPEWAASHFPPRGDRTAIDAWQPRTAYRALSSTVIAVATTRIEGTWRAYIDSVPGQNHRREWTDVMHLGATLDEPIASAIFPNFDGIPYAR